MKNYHKPLTKEEWDRMFCREIADYHGFQTLNDFSKAIEEVVPLFMWDYPNYIAFFPVVNSPLWQALK